MEVLSKIIFYLLFLTCLILPISFQISTIGAISFCVLVLFHAFVSKKGLNLKEVRVFFKLPMVIFVIPLFGLFYTSFTSQTFDLLIRYLPFLIFSITFYGAHEDIKRGAGKYLRTGIIAGVTITMLYLFISLFWNLEIENSFKEIFSYKYTYRNFTRPLDTHTTYLGLLVLMSNVFIYRSTFKIGYKTILLSINFISLLFLTSKMILLLYVFQIVTLFFFLQKRKMKLIFLVGFLMFGSTIVYLYKNNLKDMYFIQRITREIVWDFNASNVGTSVNGKIDDDSRVARWKAIISKAREKSVFGHGSGSEKALLEEIHSENGLTESIRRKYNTHNQYLFYFLEMGFFGLAFFLLFFYFNIRYVLKSKNYEIGFLLISLVLICFVENYFNRTMGVLAVSLFFTFLKDDHEKYSSGL